MFKAMFVHFQTLEEFMATTKARTELKPFIEEKGPEFVSKLFDVQH